MTLSINFNDDYNLLKGANESIFHLSNQLNNEIIKSGLTRYIELYSYFWQLIEKNKENCLICQDSTCFNRYFLLQLKDHNLNEDDLYLLVYMNTYFLDLLIAKGFSLSDAYYLLSKGHDLVINVLINKIDKSKVINNKINTEQYMGYLLSVLYYLLPNFKYKLKSYT